MHAITELREAWVSTAQPETIQRYSATTQEAEALLEDEDGDLVLYVDHMKDRNEGLAREADLRRRIENADLALSYQTRNKEALQQRLAEAQEILAKAIYLQWYDEPGYVPWVEGDNSLRQFQAREEALDQLRDGGCADGE